MKASAGPYPQIAQIFGTGGNTFFFSFLNLRNLWIIPPR